MSSLEGTRGPGSDDLYSGNEDEDDGTEGKKHRFTNFNLDSLRRDDFCERDSGLPSSGKGAGSWSGNDMSDSEERGVYDYFPTEESIKKSDSIKISHTVNPDFDEIHDVESDKSSIESPRSDASSTNEYNVTNPLEEEGTEMKTFSQQEMPSFRGYNLHKNLYSRHRDEIPYTVLQNENDDEEYCYPTSHQQRRYMGSRVSVDDTVSFPLQRSNYSHYSQTPEEAESGGFQKRDPFYSRRPPFGMENQLKNVGCSIQSLLSTKSSVANMPHGEEIPDDSRKKKNKIKKKGTKDDGDERVSNSKPRKGFMSHDENGNPIDISAYRQMRELPNKSSEGSVVSSRKHSNYGTYPQHGEFSRETSNFDTFPFTGHSAKELDDGPSNTDRKKLRKKTHKAPVKLAEDIPNYVGNIESVDDLVKFIETHKFGEKQLKKKVNQKTSPGSEIVSKADKVAKKTKDKKGKVGQVDETSDIHNESGEVICCPTSEAPISPPPPASITDVSPSITDTIHTEEEDMGNSGDKSATTNESPPLTGEKQTHNKAESKIVLNKDIDPPADKISSSKSPPLPKKEIDHKDRNKNKTKEKEKPLEATPIVENKKQKGKNGKSDLQLKNNKKLDNKNDIINNSKSVDKMKIENGPVKVVPKLGSDDLGITGNQDYIFTDIDNLPPVEQEFTLVSKKKKRQGVKDVPEPTSRQKNGPREYRGMPPPRSVTPPPSSSLLKKEQSRDLSPSSFPALGKKASVSKGRPFREGRRNSFGDVPIVSLTELGCQDDSDIESVKSLPAAKGGSLSDVVSSRFPVSYAKMAAAPKPPNSPTSPKADEDVEMFDAQSDTAGSRKPTVWKGSPTERRHSIGSSPEDTKTNKQESSPKFTQRSRQKSGSQEFLTSESVKSDDVSVPDSMDSQSSSVSASDVQHVSSSSSSDNTVSEEPVTVVSPGPQEQSPGTPSLPSSDCQNIPTITVTLDSNKVSSNVLKTGNQNGPKIASSSGPLNGPQKTMNTEVMNCTETSRSHQSVTSGSSSKDARGKTVSVSARVPNNNGRKNNKSVIFLDKRFGDAPENLGITFGFDSNLEQDVKGAYDSEPVVNISVNDIPQEANSCDKKDFINHNQIEPQSIPVTLPTDSSSKPEPSAALPSAPAAAVPSPTTGGGVVELPGSVPPSVVTSSTSSSSSLSSSNSSKMSKTRVGGLNGVVQPKTQGYRNKQGSDALRTERVTSASELKGAAASVNKDNNKTVLFFYGEGIVANIGNSGVSIDSQDRDPPSSSQHKGQLAYSPDANHKGKFNVNEAVKFLKQEWDKVLEQKDKNPLAVQYYDGQ